MGLNSERLPLQRNAIGMRANKERPLACIEDSSNIKWYISYVSF